MDLIEYLNTESDKLFTEFLQDENKYKTVNSSFLEGFNYAVAMVETFGTKEEIS